MRLIFIALVVLASCGRVESPSETSPQNKSEQTKKSQLEQSKVVPTGQPRYLMVKVPVNAAGVEDRTAMETKQVSDGVSLDTAEGAVAAFSSGQSVTVSDSDELDQSTSTQSWGWYPGKWLGRGTWWGVNPYLYYNNWYYPYNYGYQYYYSGYNYYSFYNY